MQLSFGCPENPACKVTQPKVWSIVKTTFNICDICHNIVMKTLNLMRSPSYPRRYSVIVLLLYKSRCIDEFADTLFNL